MSSPLRTIVAAATALVFTAALALSGFCATAMAQQPAGEDSVSQCPCTEKEREPEEKNHDDCCCGCQEASPMQKDGELTFSGAAVLSMASDDTMASFQPTSWWAPDLLVALWLVERLQDFDSGVEPEPAIYLSPRSDHSDTFLKHQTLLI